MRAVVHLVEELLAGDRGSKPVFLALFAPTFILKNGLVCIRAFLVLEEFFGETFEHAMVDDVNYFFLALQTGLIRIRVVYGAAVAFRCLLLLLAIGSVRRDTGV